MPPPAAVFMEVDHGGHTWPGGIRYLPKAIIGPTTHAFDVSDASWQFFASTPASARQTACTLGHVVIVIGPVTDDGAVPRRCSTRLA
jgi:hypothetical protein